MSGIIGAYLLHPWTLQFYEIVIPPGIIKLANKCYSVLTTFASIRAALLRARERMTMGDKFV